MYFFTLRLAFEVIHIHIKQSTFELTRYGKMGVITDHEGFGAIWRHQLNSFGLFINSGNGSKHFAELTVGTGLSTMMWGWASVWARLSRMMRRYRTTMRTVRTRATRVMWGWASVRARLSRLMWRMILVTLSTVSIDP